MRKRKAPKKIRKVCLNCTKVNICPREKRMADLCYYSDYNKNCRDKDEEKERQRDRRERLPEDDMHYRTKSRAKDKRFQYELEPSWYATRLARGICELTGLPFEKLPYGPDNRGKPGPYTPSVDRIDNTKGYTPDNCRMVVWMVNKAKSNYSDTDLHRVSKAITAAEIALQLGVCLNKVNNVEEGILKSEEHTMDVTLNNVMKDIIQCAEESDIEGLQACLRSGDDINTLKDGRNALFYTTDMSCAKWLIQHGIDVDHEDENGMTAVHAAIYAGEHELAQYLIRLSTRREWASLTMDQIHRSCERDILRCSAHAVLTQHGRKMPMVR